MVEVLKGDGAAILSVFVGALIAIVIIAAIGTAVVASTETGTVVNLTFTPSNVNVTPGTLLTPGRDVLAGTVLITNETGTTGNTDIGTAARYSIQNFVANDGLVHSYLVTNSSAGPDGGYNVSVNLSYEYRGTGYINDSGGRAIAGLITLFAALAIVVFVIVVFVKRGSMGPLLRS